MADKFVTLTDGKGNNLYPVTPVSNVYREEKNLETLITEFESNIKSLQDNKADKVVLDTYVTDDELEGKKYATEAYVDEKGGKIDSISVNGEPQPIIGKNVNITIPEGDYTEAEKTKLASIAEGAQVNVLEKISIDGKEQTINNKAIDMPISPVYKGTCSTTQSTTTKAVTIKDFVLKVGSKIEVTFTNAGVNNASLKTNSDNAYSICYYGNGSSISYITTTWGIDSGVWEAGDTVQFIFNGSYWVQTYNVTKATPIGHGLIHFIEQRDVGIYATGDTGMPDVPVLLSGSLATNKTNVNQKVLKDSNFTYSSNTGTLKVGAVRTKQISDGTTTVLVSDIIKKGDAVSSVNGSTGDVSINYGANLSLSIDNSTYIVTAQLKDQNGNSIGDAQTIDLPLESVVVDGHFDEDTDEVVLVLKSGSEIRFSVTDIISGLPTKNYVDAQDNATLGSAKNYTDAEIETLSSQKVNKTTSVNGKALSGNITLDASDVGALSSTTKYGSSLGVNGTSVTLKDQDGNTLSTITTQDTTYTNATASAAGLMSAADKSKLDNIAEGADKTEIDDALSTTSINSVQNKVITSALNTTNNSISDLSDRVTQLDENKVDKTTEINGHSLESNVTITKADIGLGAVNNTSDLNKPISTATQGALDKKLDKTTADVAFISNVGLSYDVNLEGYRITYSHRNLLTGTVTNVSGSAIKPATSTLSGLLTSDKLAEIESNTANISSLQSTKLDASKANKNVMTDSSISANGDNVSLDKSYINLSTQSTSTNKTTVPLANDTTAGLMSVADYNEIRSLGNRVQNLESKTTRLLYIDSTNPTSTDINTFVTSLGYESPFEGIAVVIDETYHIWHYYEGGIGWKDDGLDTVTQFTNDVAGIIKGSTAIGKIYAETDGTGSVNGWDNLSNQVSTNASNITTLSSSKVDKIEGKGLSTNDYTNEEKAKVSQNQNDISSLKTNKANQSALDITNDNLANLTTRVTNVEISKLDVEDGNEIRSLFDDYDDIEDIYYKITGSRTTSSNTNLFRDDSVVINPTNDVVQPLLDGNGIPYQQLIKGNRYYSATLTFTGTADRLYPEAVSTTNNLTGVRTITFNIDNDNYDYHFTLKFIDRAGELYGPITVDNVTYDKYSAFVYNYTGTGTDSTPTIVVRYFNKVYKNVEGMVKDVDNLVNYTKTADLAAVATSGSYNDLNDLPEIPEGSVVYQTFGQFTDGAISQKVVTDKVTEIEASIANVTPKDGVLTIQKNGTDIVTFSANQESAAVANISIPDGVIYIEGDADDDTVYDNDTRWVVYGVYANGVYVSNLYKGMTIAYKVATPSDGTRTSLRINGLGDKKVVNANLEPITGNLPVGTILVLTYDGTNWIWSDFGNNDSNIIRYKVPVVSNGYINEGELIAANDSGYQPIDNMSSFNIDYPILYAKSKFYTGETSDNNYIYCIANNIGPGVSFTTNKPVYLKGNLSGRLFSPHTTTSGMSFIQNPPTSEDGYQYILMGVATAATSMQLFINHPIYEYKDGAFRLYEYVSENIITETKLLNKGYETITNVNSKDAETLNSSKSYTDTQIASLINGAPETLDTLDELAAALKDNADIVDTLNSAIGNKANKSHTHTKSEITDFGSYLSTSGGTLTGTVTMTGGDFLARYVGISTAGHETGTYDKIAILSSTTNGYIRYRTKAELASDLSVPTDYAKKAEGVYLVDGTGNTTAGTWEGTNNRITSYYDGLTVNFKIGVAGANPTTLNINGLGAKTCYLRGTSKVTTHYAVGTMVLFTYNATTDAFYSSDYDSNTSVTQTVRTTNGDFPLLLRGTSAGTTTTTTSTTFGTKFLANPSTGELKATKFTENGTTLASKYLGISANAASATKATQDGSGNVITSTYAKKTELPNLDNYVTINTEQTISGNKIFSNSVVVPDMEV